MEGKCRTENIIYKYISTSGHPGKAYLGTAERDFQIDHISSFKNKIQTNKTTWEVKEKHYITPTLKWHIVKSVTS